jgi:very-short-patch-repair endonuclease
MSSKKTLKVNFKPKTKRTKLEDDFAKQLYGAGIRGYRRNARFLDGRKFEADFWFPRLLLILEVDGGLWMSRGGHTTGRGAMRDRERDILAYTSRGILTLRLASDHIKSGEGIEWVKEAIERRRKEILGDSA